LGWGRHFCRARRFGGDLGDEDDASMIKKLPHVPLIGRRVIEGRSYICLLWNGFGVGISRPLPGVQRTRGRVSFDLLAERGKNGGKDRTC